MKSWVLLAILMDPSTGHVHNVPVAYFATQSQCNQAAPYLVGRRAKGWFCLQGYEKT